MQNPRTPIKITPAGQVLAWCWNGQERDGPAKLPVFRLKKPTPGMWRNGRLLSFPNNFRGTIQKA